LLLFAVVARTGGVADDPKANGPPLVDMHAAVYDVTAEPLPLTGAKLTEICESPGVTVGCNAAAGRPARVEPAGDDGLTPIPLVDVTLQE